MPIATDYAHDGSVHRFDCAALTGMECNQRCAECRDCAARASNAVPKNDWNKIDQMPAPEVLRGLCYFATFAESEGLHDRDEDSRAALEWLKQVAGWTPESERDAAYRERRLSALRTATGKTDAQVVAEAEAGTMSRDASYAEWLVLLGRSDLLP